jgi:hypothetical protein
LKLLIFPALRVAASQRCASARIENFTSVATGSRPVLFQISQPSGEYAASVKARFFEIVAIEYALRVYFRKVVAGSEAARRLHPCTVINLSTRLRCPTEAPV